MAGELGQVTGTQLVRGDPASAEFVHQARPPRSGASGQRATVGRLERPDVDAAVVVQVSVGESGAHWVGEQVPRHVIDLVGTLAADCGAVSLSRWRRSSFPVSPRLATFEAFHRLHEAEVEATSQIVDDISRGAAAEAVEPVRDAAHGQGGGDVLVERAAPDEAVAARLQLDPGCGHHLVDRVRTAHLCDVDRTAREPPHGSITRPAAGARFGNAESRIVYERTMSLNAATSMWTSTSSA